MSDYVIRPLELADSSDLCALIRALSRHHGETAGVSTRDVMRLCFGATPWLNVMVVDLHGTLVGYAAMCRRARLHRGMAGMNLHHLFVLAEHRGQGVGRGLVAAARQLAVDAGCGYLDVAADRDNLAAHAFYEAAGFARIEKPGQPFVMAIDQSGFRRA